MVSFLFKRDQFTAQHGLLDLHPDHVLLLTEAVGVPRLRDLLQIVQQRQGLLCQLCARGGKVMHGVGLFDSGRQIGPACSHLSAGLRRFSRGHFALQVALAIPGHALHQRVTRVARLRRQ